jgi:hypothetical protein
LLGLFPLITPDPAYANVGRVLDQALASGRPVYLIKPMDGLQIKADLTPAGPLFRATALQNSPAHLVNQLLPEIRLQAGSDKTITETISLQGYDLSSEKIGPGEPITVTLYWQPTQPLTIDYTSYVHLVNSSNQGIAQSDHRPGGDFYPSHFWQMGEIIRDQHTFILPADAPAGAYRLRVGIYYQPEAGLIESMGQGLEIGSLAIE